jgi:molybdopterin-guanine dinucleotide biosynthesis protein A
MGTDKALLDVDGQPLARTVALALRAAGADPVVAVGGDLEGLGAVGVQAVADLHPGEGPLGGVLTALQTVPAEIVVVLACDLPDVDPDVVRAVVAALGEADDVAAPLHDGHLQLLHAAYRRTAQPALAEAFAAGERALHRAVQGLRTAVVTDLPSEPLVDVDEPEDLERRGGGAPG